MWVLRSLASLSAIVPVSPDRRCTLIQSRQISSCSFSNEGGADRGMRKLREMIDTYSYSTLCHTAQYRLGIVRVYKKTVSLYPRRVIRLLILDGKSGEDGRGFNVENNRY